MAGQGNNPCLFIYRISSVNSVSVQLVAGVREVWQLDWCVLCHQRRLCEQLERVQCASGAALLLHQKIIKSKQSGGLVPPNAE